MICPNQSNRGPLKKEKKKELKCGSLPTADIVGAVGKSKDDLKKIRMTLRNEDDLKIEDDLNNACFFWVEFQKESTGNI